MLWQANIDIQFVAESSLALAHYVSGYVTKAERSNIQDIWHEVKIKMFIAVFGALEYVVYVVYVLESVVYMRLVIFYLVITYVKSLTL